MPLSIAAGDNVPAVGYGWAPFPQAAGAQVPAAAVQELPFVQGGALPADRQRRGREAGRAAGHYRVAMTCAQIAIIPRNSASDVRAAASSAIVRNIQLSSCQEQKENIVLIMF